MKIRSITLLFTAGVLLAACDGMKEALTAHVDVAARAEGQELSVQRLSSLMGNSTLQIPVNREVALLLTEMWENYHLLGTAAARGDSLSDPKAVEDAMRGIMSNLKLRAFMQKVGTSLKADSATETGYNQAAADIFHARHILFPLPGGATQEQKDSVRRVAEGVRARVTNANFADLARRHSSDPGSAQQGGSLGAFPRGIMVKPFGDAVAALRPGEISQPIETSFGYHVIQRSPYAVAKAQYDQTFRELSGQRAESIYVSKIDTDAKIEVRAGAPALAKEVARDLNAHRDNDDVLATFKGGNLDVAKFVGWLEAYPPQMRLPQQMAQAPDSLVRLFVKSIARQEVMLKMADSAGVSITPEERTQIQTDFKQTIGMVWQQLGIDPRALADSAKSTPEREKLAAQRVEAYLDQVMSGQAQPLQVPAPLRAVLADKYEAKTYPAGVDRALEAARQIRQVADSTRAALQPRSQVPLPTAPVTPPAGSKRP
jgi:hypothetical protein